MQLIEGQMCLLFFLIKKRRQIRSNKMRIESARVRVTFKHFNCLSLIFKAVLIMSVICTFKVNKKKAAVSGCADAPSRISTIQPMQKNTCEKKQQSRSQAHVVFAGFFWLTHGLPARAAENQCGAVQTAHNS